MWGVFNYVFLLTLLLLMKFVHAWNDDFPVRCEKFTDQRTKPETDILDRTVLKIPPHLTNERTDELKFHLGNRHSRFNTTQTQRCNNHPTDTIEISLLMPPGNIQLSPQTYFFQNQGQFAGLVFFTEDGYLHRNGHYWHYFDYCIESISDDNLIIQSCKLNCSADLSKTYLHSRYPHYEASRICIPKCCGIDETLSLTDGTCRRFSDSEPTYFLPYLHLQQPIWYLEENKAVKDKHKVLVYPVLNPSRQTWNSTHGITGGSDSLWGYLHFSRNEMQCQNYTWRVVPYNQVNSEAQNYPRNGQNFRIEVHPGQVKLFFLRKNGKWEEYKEKFCVDGVDGWGKGLEEQPVNQVVVFCVDNQTSIADIVSRASMNSLKTLHIPTLYLPYTLCLYAVIKLMF